MSEHYTAREVHPVMTMAGIMPGGTEMQSWYGHIPFPTPAQLDLKRTELLAEIERWTARKTLAAGRRPVGEPAEITGKRIA